MHYVYSAEHSFSDRVEGEEATRSGVLIWDALALKGSCHIWIDGEGGAASEGVTAGFSGREDRSLGDDVYNGARFYLVEDCPGMGTTAKAYRMWKASVKADGTVEWKPCVGRV